MLSIEQREHGLLKQLYSSMLHLQVF